MCQYSPLNSAVKDQAYLSQMFKLPAGRGCRTEWLLRAELGDNWLKAIERCNADYEKNHKQSQEASINSEIQRQYGWYPLYEPGAGVGCNPGSESFNCY